MRKTIAVILASAIALQPQKTNANPAAIVAPVAFCAGTADLGCVLVATSIVGGVVYYVWQRSDGKRLKTKQSVVASEIGGIEASKRGEAHWGSSEDNCAKHSRRLQKKLKATIPAKGGGYWCIF